MDDGQTDKKFDLSRNLKKISPNHIIYQDHVDPTWELCSSDVLRTTPVETYYKSTIIM